MAVDTSVDFTGERNAKNQNAVGVSVPKGATGKLAPDFQSASLGPLVCKIMDRRATSLLLPTAHTFR